MLVVEIPSTPTTKRKTPTQKQLEQLEQLENLDAEALLTRALAALHDLNRRAKEKRDRAQEYRGMRFADAVRDEIDAIYALKDRFLDALVRSDLAKVYRFEHEGRPEWFCCGRTWYGHDDTCFRCGFAGDDIAEPETWCVVECRGYRFHRPNPTAELLARATEIEPHDPGQPQKAIPDVGLTIAAQHGCVELAIERLRTVREAASEVA